jgi:hypothetical protein
MTSTSQADLPTHRRMTSRRIGLAMVAEAATFAVASAIHFGTGFTQAAIPELLIAAVLAAGSSAVIAQRAHGWGAAVGATAFAAFGTMVGLAIIASGRQDVPDLVYHASILTALVITLAGLARTRRGW